MSADRYVGQRGSASPARERHVTEAIRRWTDQLMDVSGRNQLLFYRDLKVGTLDPAVLPDRLKDARTS